MVISSRIIESNFMRTQKRTAFAQIRSPGSQWTILWAPKSCFGSRIVAYLRHEDPFGCTRRTTLREEVAFMCEKLRSGPGFGG